MVFSSTFFLFGFLPVFLVIYHLVSEKAKNIVLLLASIGFYAWGAPKFLFILLLSLIVNFYVVRRMNNAEQHKRIWLWISIVLNLGLLAYFKYANFFIDNLNALLNAMHCKTVSWTRIALPIGISFFTFQSLTYTVDVYRKVHQPLNRLNNYLLYILMFPQLVAGPIVRFNTIADDILDRRHNQTIDHKLYGIYRFALGLAKKVLIANIIGEQVDIIYGMSHEMVTASVARVAALGYAFQIYFDFSGYSDMAIGLGYLLGFKFPENFDNPYVSKNITEFWRRWHITLGSWFRDYLYIPLGGNRVKPWRMYVNLGIVFLVCGIWHGAGWNFVVWGIWHGLFIISDKLFLNKLMDKWPRFIRTLLTFTVVTLGWVFFRLDSLGDAMFFISKIFSPHIDALSLNAEFITMLCIAVLFSFITLSNKGLRLQEMVYAFARKEWQHYVSFAVAMLLLFACATCLASSSFNPFIYFKF